MCLEQDIERPVEVTAPLLPVAAAGVRGGPRHHAPAAGLPGNRSAAPAALSIPKQAAVMQPSSAVAVTGKKVESSPSGQLEGNDGDGDGNDVDGCVLMKFLLPCP